MTPNELLEIAADDIAKYGHHHGAYSDDRFHESIAPACAYGALTRAATGTTTNYAVAQTDLVLQSQIDLINQAAELLAKAITPNPVGYGHPFRTITVYNDSTIGPDMIRTMKEAATMADIGEEVTTIDFEPLPETVPETTPAAPAQPAEPVPA